MSVPNRFAVGLAKAHGPVFTKTEFATDSPLEGTGFELPVRGRGQSLLCRRKLGTGRRALSVFGQHDALHQSGVDPTAEAAVRAGDAQRRILRGPERKRQRSTG